MGGFIFGGNMILVVEFNVFIDLDVVKIMYNVGVLIVMVGLDVILKVFLILVS